MIKSFSNKDLKNLYYEGQIKGINQDHKFITKNQQVYTAQARSSSFQHGCWNPVPRMVYIEHIPVTGFASRSSALASPPVTKLAQCLGVSRITVSKIVNERAPVTADMALRLAKTFDTTAELWLGLQKQYDL